MSKILHVVLLLATMAQLSIAALLARGVPQNHAKPKTLRRPNDRKTFLRWDRDEQFDRAQDRERFREELTRTMHQVMQNHNTKTQLANIEAEAVRDLEKRFSRTKRRLSEMTSHTIEAIDDMLALT